MNSTKGHEIDELRKNEARYRVLLDTMKHGVQVNDCEGTITYSNRAHHSILGYEEGELLGKKIWNDVSAADDREALRSYLKVLVKEQPKPVPYFNECTRNDGTPVSLQIDWDYERDDTGAVTGFISVITDITERKQSENLLKENEKFLNSVFDAIQDGISVLDSDFNIIRVNKTMRKWYAHMLPFEGKKKCYEVYHNRSVPCEVCPTIKTLTSGKLETNQVPFVTAEGQAGHLELFAYPIFNNSGEVTGVVEYVRDITAQEKAENERIILENHLRQAHKMEAIGTLTGGIAHDFNNILAIILGNAELAFLNTTDSHPAQSNIKQILSASNRAKNLVKHLLTFSRKEEVEKSTVDLCQVVQECMRTLHSTLPKSVQLEVQVPNGCSNSIDDRLVIEADPIQLDQLLMNLCVNAVDAMDEKGTLTVSLDEIIFQDDIPVSRLGVKPGTYGHLTVSDTGHGVTPELIDKIFDPFFTTKGVEKGTGMGLSVVQGIVTSHGGYIFVESGLGKGTTFHVYLPASKKKKAETDSDEICQLSTGKEKILFVDDEELVVEVNKLMLESLGYSVTTLDDSIEALALFKNNPHRFDLVITDQTMPNMSGSELSQKLLSVRPDIPIIICTGFSSKITKESCEEFGVRALAMKPLDYKEIAELVRQVLDGVS